MIFHKANKLSSDITWVHSRTLNVIPYIQNRASRGRAACWSPCSVLNNHMMNTREPCRDMGDFTSPQLCFGFGCCLFVGHWPFFYFLLEVRKSDTCWKWKHLLGGKVGMHTKIKSCTSCNHRIKEHKALPPSKNMMKLKT